MSLVKRTPIDGGSYISSVARDWAYQDFSAITNTSVTLTADQNGNNTAFDTNSIINGYAFVSNVKGEDLIYSGAVRLFSSKIAVASQNKASLTLNAVPHVAWGTVRIWYLRTYANGIPADHLNAPGFIKDTQVITLDNLFISEEEMTSHKSGADHDARYQLTAPVILSKAYSDSPYAASDGNFINYDTTSGNSIVILPAIGRVTVRWSGGANPLTVNVIGSGTINGAAAYVFNSLYDCAEFKSFGNGIWGIV